MPSPDRVETMSITSTADWLQEITALTDHGAGRCITDPEDARRVAAALRAAATSLCGGTPCTCGGQEPCARGLADRRLCALAERLAGPPVPDAPGDPPAAERYVALLRDVTAAVATCRRVAHPAGECWFSPDGAERCGEVLAVAHRVS